MYIYIYIYLYIINASIHMYYVMIAYDFLTNCDNTILNINHMHMYIFHFKNCI